jgi:acyl-CoA reductase-like NAD-dependent aldehyde dehydrogenase
MKAAPCLATGNTLIIKPSEYSPLGSLAIAPLFEKAGFPKGVFQVVTGAGDTGALLAGHMRIRKVIFTRILKRPHAQIFLRSVSPAVLLLGRKFKLPLRKAI